MSVAAVATGSSIDPLTDASGKTVSPPTSSRLWLTLRARDPIVCRDHRPLSEGSRRRTLDWISPGMMAGGVRNLVAVLNGFTYSSTELDWLKKHVRVAGPFPLIGAEAASGSLYLPSPADCVYNGKKPHCLRPDKASAGKTDLPNGILPLVIESEDSTDMFKPTERPAFWPETDITKWLTTSPWKGPSDIKGRRSPLHDIRSHVTQDTSRGAALDGQLFSTAGLELRSLPKSETNSIEDQRRELFRNKDCLYLRVAVEISGDAHAARAAALRNFRGWHPLGGEGRVIHWTAEEPGSFEMPPRLSIAISGTKWLRMMLVTPALFENGWIPNWIDNSTLTGTIPNTNIEVQLISAAVERWRPVSGWSLETRTHKSLRRAVPEGAVYFFQRASGDVENLKKMWMGSVCDDPQNIADGYGLAVWGVW